MRTKTNVKAGGFLTHNHNQTAVRGKGLPVRSSVKAGGFIIYNHNQTQVRGSDGLRVKSSLKAGRRDDGLNPNHNQTAVRSSEGLRVKSSVKAGRSGWENHNQTAVRAKSLVS
jgi:hypothetical protein